MKFFPSHAPYAKEAKILNLPYPEKSEIPFKIIEFSDHQHLIQINASAKELSECVIFSRMDSFVDVEILICANNALKEMGAQKVHLYVPYFLGSRSDRKFTEGSSNYLKTVICPLINLQHFESVTVLDPHSDVLEACLERFHKIDEVPLVQTMLEQTWPGGSSPGRVFLVSPDAGALKKVYHVAETLGIDKVLVASKHRDIKTGEILSTSISGLEECGASDSLVVVDDICDGGRTFIELAKVIRKYNTESALYLVVSHGIFSAGLTGIKEHYQKIFTTNTIKDISDDGVHQMDIFS